MWRENKAHSNFHIPSIQIIKQNPCIDQNNVKLIRFLFDTHRQTITCSSDRIDVYFLN